MKIFNYNEIYSLNVVHVTKDVLRCTIGWGIRCIGRETMANTAENAWHRLTMASEDYLETIYRIMQEENAFEGIRSKDVADQLEVSKASVNKALNVLKENGYVEQNRYGRIQLTNTGREYAAHIWRCHRMIRSFLVQDLGVASETADNEACLMEHAISTDTQNRWLAYLDKQGITIEE